MGFSRQEYWSWLPFPSPGDLPDPGIEPGSPTFEADALTSEPPWNAKEAKLKWCHIYRPSRTNTKEISPSHQRLDAKVGNQEIHGNSVISQHSGLPWWLSKESASNVGDPGSSPGSGRSPGEGNGNSLQYSCLGNPVDSVA